MYEGEFKNAHINDTEVIDEYDIYENILGSSTLTKLPQLTTNMSLIVYALTQNTYFDDLPDFLKSSNANVSMLQDYDDKHSDDGTNTPLDYSDDVSEFNIKRRSVIINTIVEVLNDK